MTFDKQYPDAETLTQVEFDGDFTIKAGESKPCYICGITTSWLNGSFQTFICSPECANKLWNEYNEACIEREYQESSNEEKANEQ